MEYIKNAIYMREMRELAQEDLPFHELAGKRILITGATGLIGSYLVDFFLYLRREKGVSLFVSVLCRNMDKANKRFSEYLGEDGFDVLQGDLSEEIQMHQSFDYIIHGASNNHPQVFAKEPVETMKTIFIGTMQLLEHAKKDKAQLLLLSTGEVYGTNYQGDKEGCIEKDAGVVDSLNVRSCYPEAKKAAETLCVSYEKQYNVDIRIARLCYIFGATFQRESTKADVQFLKKAIEKENIVMKSKGEQYRSYCYIADAVRGLLFIMLKGKQGECYNIADRNGNMTIREFAENIADVAKVQIVTELADNVGNSVMKTEILNPSKLEKMGFLCKVGVKQGIEHVLHINSMER